MATSDWFYAKGNRQLGPVSSTELKQLAESGQLMPDDLVWHEGMVEWTSADKVKGLFDPPAEESSREESSREESSRGESSRGESSREESSRGESSREESAFAQGPPSKAAASRFASSPAEPGAHAPGKHVFDMLIELIQRQCPAQFVDASSEVFSVVGFYGLYAGMAMLLVLAVVLGATLGSLPLLLATCAAGILLLAVLQYASGKFLGRLDTFNRSTSARISSTAVPDCCALLSITGGLVLLVTLVIIALEPGDFTVILWAIGLFILCEYVAILSLTPDALNVKVQTNSSAGEEALGVLWFLTKLIPRLVPVAFGLGVVLGTCDLIISALLTVLGSGDETVETAGGLIALWNGGAMLFAAAALPIVAYVLFLLAHLAIDLLNSILTLPRQLNNDEPGKDGSDADQP